MKNKEQVCDRKCQDADKIMPSTVEFIDCARRCVSATCFDDIYGKDPVNMSSMCFIFSIGMNDREEMMLGRG